MLRLLNENCIDVLNREEGLENSIIITDPPFNINYHYKTYKDKLKEEDYYKMLVYVLSKTTKFVVIHYPEQMHKLTLALGFAPEKIVSWVYNSNTKKQHRVIAFYGFTPDFSKVKQPYKNPNDKRIKKLIENGSMGTNIYDWWNINQVKNVSKEKTSHPCQMPLEVMKNIIGIIPDGFKIIDPFMGSGTTAVAATEYGRDFLGMELDRDYYKIAVERMDKYVC